MCGINGIVSRRQLTDDQLTATLQRMTDGIFHRGPGDDGTSLVRNAGCVVGMGMRRLSIIDLVSGSQPILSADNKLAIVFNGEIYNYRELRAELKEKGVVFSTSSDTEVVLKLYEAEGTDSLNRLDGMFGLSIHDCRSNTIVLARDYFGEKPLYYLHDSNGLQWASELKSLTGEMKTLPEISIEALNLYFRLGYIPAPLTIYSGVCKLPQDSILEYNTVSNELVVRELPAKSFDLPEVETEESAARVVREAVRESVVSRTVADVPVGSFLSGGVDSSIVTACLAESSSSPIPTFSIGYDNKHFDESEKAETVASRFNCEHHKFILSESDIQPLLGKILLNFDEPFADMAALPTHFLSLKTREHVKVALTGDGGDEVFAGYNKHYMGRLNRAYTGAIPRRLHNAMLPLADKLLSGKHDQRGRKFQIRKLLNGIDYDGDHYWNIISLANNEESLAQLLPGNKLVDQPFTRYKEQLKDHKQLSLTHFRAIDRLVSLEGGLLPKVDRTSMLASLECRAPFLNRSLWQIAKHIPERLLIKGWNKKYILKKAFADLFPDRFLDAPKKGFGTPVGDWLRQGLGKDLKHWSEPELIRRQGLFNVDEVGRLVSSHQSGEQDNTFRIWAFFCFQHWYFNSYEAS